MGDVRVIFGDRLRPGLALKGGYLLPEIIEHGVGRRVPIMSSAVRLTTRDYVYSRRLLIHDRRLHDPVLGIGHVFRSQQSQDHQTIQRLIPARDAISADHGRGVFRIASHSASPSTRCVRRRRLRLFLQQLSYPDLAGAANFTQAVEL